MGALERYPKGSPGLASPLCSGVGDHGGVVLGVPRLSLRLFPCSLRYSRLTSACCQDLAAVLSTSPSLEELDLSFSDGLRDAGVELLSAPSHIPAPASRSLGSCRLTGACRRALAMGTPPLTCLDLSDNELGADGVLELCRWLRSPSCPLRTLGAAGRGTLELLCCGPGLSLRLFPCSLRYSRLTSACCQDLAAVLSTSPSLEELDLSFSDGLRDAGVELLCQGLQPRSYRLRTLRLGSCRLTGACCRALAMGTPPLTCLDLSDNELGADGVLELCRWLRSPSCPLRTLG
uniref:Uncharacterized protein n=1 Tax=Melopsittacus undulatus TaxID=13146 RepID=A0A8V5G1Y7_MELUD